MKESITKKQCPHCKTEIDADATKCPHCQSDLRSWVSRHKLATAMGVVILLGFFGSIIPSHKNSNFNDIKLPVNVYILSEAECQKVTNEIIAVANQTPTEKSQLSKSLLEQYAQDAGLVIKVAGGSLTRYVMPKSDCGKALDGLLLTVITGAKRDLSR